MKWFCLLFPLSALAATPPSLIELHQLASQRSETLEIAESRESQAEERTGRARGTLLPSLSARYNYQAVDAMPGPQSPFTRLNQYSVLLNVTQTVYNGAAYPAYSFSKLDYELQQRLKEQEGLGVWSSSAEAYYALWMAQNDVTNALELRKFSDERVQELKERVRVGRSRRGELMQAEAQLASVNAELARTQNALVAAEEQVQFLAGQKFNPAFGPIPESTAQVGPLGEYLQKIPQRPDVKASAQSVELVEKEVSIAKAGHQPTVNLSANYYLERTGVLAESDWDLGVAVVMPLYQGGTVSAVTRETVERKRERVLTYERLKRESERDVRILWQNAQTLESVVSQLKVARTKAEGTYQENKKDYRYGLVTSLDVLVAMNDYIDTKRGLERAILEKELVALQLKLATGETP